VFKRWFGGGDAPREPEPLEREAAREQVRSGLERTRGGALARLGELFGAGDIVEGTWDELEERLIRGDLGARTAAALVADLREQARYAGVRRADELPRLLRRVMIRALEQAPDADGSDSTSDAPHEGPHIVLMVGVNGSGKTTTAAKLAAHAAREGRSVLLVAADTFRAAAIDQLAAWAERLGVPIVRGTPGGDPGAVVYDALRSGVGRAADLVLIDTAGRLHTQRNLMAELQKVRRIVETAVPGAPHETLLVLDATTGQNGLAQAREFLAAVAVTGVVLAKLDSSARGGIAFAVTRELGLPLRFVGVGEGVADILPFDAAAYVDGLLATEPA